MTCDKGIPGSASTGEAGRLQHQAAQLAELEHQAGTHLSLCEHLPPHKSLHPRPWTYPTQGVPAKPAP